MTNACQLYYEQLHAASAKVLADSFLGERADAMAKNHAFIGDLSAWLTELRTRPEMSVLRSALTEYQFALLALSTGHYRAAFAALRLTLELSFAAIQWSANERELREWLRGERDSNWASISDSENGILSKRFVRLFSEALSEEASTYRASAIAVYRECSEYVHGNAQTNRTIPEQLEFHLQSFDAWISKSSVVRLTISFALAARYLVDLDPEVRLRLEGMLIDRLGHSVGVRSLLGATVEVADV